MYTDLKVFVSKSEIFVRFLFSQCIDKQTQYKKKNYELILLILVSTRKETIHYDCFFLVKQSLKKREDSGQNTKYMYVFKVQ